MILSSVFFFVFVFLGGGRLRGNGSNFWRNHDKLLVLFVARGFVHVISSLFCTEQLVFKINLVCKVDVADTSFIGD